jgi:hypothetical protein
MSSRRRGQEFKPCLRKVFFQAKKVRGCSYYKVGGVFIKLKAVFKFSSQIKQVQTCLNMLLKTY